MKVHQMKDQWIKRLILGIAIVAQVLFYQNCSKVGVSSIDDDAAKSINDPAGTCTERLEYATNPIKILLVIDNSGSNVDHIGEDGVTPVPGTDNNKVWRMGLINDVLARYGSNKNISYGLISFANTYATPHIKDSSGKGIFTNDLAAVRAGVENYKATAEQPETPLQQALFYAKDMIAQDIAAHPGEGAGYAVVIMGDGVPSKVSYNNQPPSAVIPDAQAIVDLSPDLITLNAVFYHLGNPDTSHFAFLQNIASTGHGKFMEANTNNTFVTDQLIEYSKKICD